LQGRQQHEQFVDVELRRRHPPELSQDSFKNIQDQIEGIIMQKIDRSALAQQAQIAGGCKGGSANNSAQANSVVIIYR
jgi:hypothetical protein